MFYVRRLRAAAVTRAVALLIDHVTLFLISIFIIIHRHA